MGAYVCQTSNTNSLCDNVGANTSEEVMDDEALHVALLARGLLDSSVERMTDKDEQSPSGCRQEHAMLMTWNKFGCALL